MTTQTYDSRAYCSSPSIRTMGAGLSYLACTAGMRASTIAKAHHTIARSFLDYIAHKTKTQFSTYPLYPLVQLKVHHRPQVTRHRTSLPAHICSSTSSPTSHEWKVSDRCIYRGEESDDHDSNIQLPEPGRARGSSFQPQTHLRIIQDALIQIFHGVHDFFLHSLWQSTSLSFHTLGHLDSVSSMARSGGRRW